MLGGVASARRLVNLCAILAHALRPMTQPRKDKERAQGSPQPRGVARRAPEPDPTFAAAPAPQAISAATKLRAQVEALRVELAALRAQVAELEAQAHIDALSNILNRRGFERELNRALSYVARYGTTAALVCLDFDAFKPINDTYGHAAGDAALKAAAAALVANVRGSDSVGRLGGDEFAIVLWNLNAASAAAKALALEGTVARTPVRWEGASIRLAASAGWTMLKPGDDPVAVLARADAAMYARKRERRGS
jgi:diguanylate cyclase (GGDEF)-like protein